MKAEVTSLRVVSIPDEMPDASYLEQEGLGFEERLGAYRRGEFGFIGVRAVASLRIGPISSDGRVSILEEVTSPGLWGIEDDSDADYLRDVGAEEVSTLTGMLEALGFGPRDLPEVEVTF